MKKYKLQSILAPAFKMLEAGFDLTVPLLVARIIDDGIAAGNTQVIWSNFALMLLMALLGLACSSVFCGKGGNWICRRLKTGSSEAYSGS